MIPPSLAGASALRGAALQFGCAVHDLDAAIQHWTGLLGVGPWVVLHNYPGQVRTHRGQRVDVQSDIAFTYWGDIQVELIHQRNNAPTPYQEFFAEGKDGLQHLGFFVHDYPATVAQMKAMGLEEIYTSVAPTGRYPTIYFSAPPTLGLMIEIVAMEEGRARMFNALRGLRENWDGSNPVRHYENGLEFMRAQGLA